MNDPVGGFPNRRCTEGYEFSIIRLFHPIRPSQPAVVLQNTQQYQMKPGPGDYTNFD